MGLAELETIPETGAVFTIGRSRFADNIASHFFIRKDPVVSITCGDEHSAVICQTGRLFVFGSNDWGQLGLGHKNHVSKPSCVKALKPEKVTHVACGRAHTLICTGAQKIYACGSDQEGQLGRGTSAIGDSVNTPVLVYDAGLAGSKIVQIAAGSHHSLALTNDGGVFAWGSNLEGQLGLPDVPGLVNKPTKVHVPEPVKQISTGYYHSTFLTESGLVYVCGESESGKLGIDVNFSTQVAPKQMQLPSPAVHVACGGHHTVILADNGNLYCAGSNSSGQLGLGTNVAELHTPKLLPRGAIQDEKVTRISCGESHTAIVTDTGKLFTCGDGRHGKLGLEENENNVHEFTLVQRYNELFVSNVACGGCHTILVGQRRETGQTETDNSQTDHVQKRKNSLPPLKLPLSRLQSETRDGTVNQIIKDQLSPEMKNMESATNAQSTVEKASEKLEEIANNKDNVIGNVTDPANGTEKSEENAKENTEDSTKPPEKESLDTVSSEMKNETAGKEMPGSGEESQESQVENENKEPKRDNDKSEMEVDKENNVQKENESDSMDNKNDHENNNETNEKATKSDSEMDEQITSKNDTAKSEDTVDGKEIGNDDKSEPMKEQTEASKEDEVKEENSSEKPTSPTNSTPPPKPPRLKPGSGNSNERSSSMEKETADVYAENEDKRDKEGSERNEENGSEKKEESVSTKSGSSKSMRSKVGTEETIEIDKQDDKEQIMEEKEMKNDNVQDDADVVQSPPPRTSKMSKIFRSSREKKSEAIENDTKTNGTTNHKQKSKMCTIL